MTDEISAGATSPQWPVADEAILDVFQQMYRDGSWGRYHGPHCDRLRAALEAFHKTKHVHLCSSGTSAIELALRAARVSPGDEVILAAYDYKANFKNVLTLGATPVLVDTLPGLPIPDPMQLKDALNEKTRAVICSHLHGCFAPLDAVRNAMSEHDVVLIEDACQAAGGLLAERPAGSIGDIGVLSFGGSKLLTAGRGGAILTSNPTLAQRIRLYTQRGNDAYPLSEMQAAVLLPQLNRLHERTQTRLRNVRVLLSSLPADGPLTAALLEPGSDGDVTIPAFYKVPFRYCPGPDGNLSRDEYAERVRDRGVALGAAFPALHRIHSTRRYRAVGQLRNADALHDDLLTLHHPILLSDDVQIRNTARLLVDAAAADPLG